MTEISDEELERRLRANGWAERASSALSSDDRLMAEKLFGKHEADRYVRTGGRGYRYRPPNVTAEYFEYPGDAYGHGGWMIIVFVNGARWRSKGGMSKEDCLAVIRRLEKRGVRAKLFITEAMRREQEAAQKASSRPRRQECQKGSDRYLRRFGRFA